MRQAGIDSEKLSAKFSKHPTVFMAICGILWHPPLQEALMIRPISPCRSAELRRRLVVCDQVLVRDQGLCVLCGSYWDEVHEVIPRSHFGKKGKEHCYQLKNMVAICRACHEQSHTRPARIKIITILADRFGYDYSDRPWSEYTP